MDAPVPLILAALLAAGALVARAPRVRAAAMLGALVLAPVILGFHIADSDQVKPLRDHPSLAVAGAVGRRGRSRRCWRCSSTAGRRGCRSPPRRPCPSACRSPRAARRPTCSCRSTSSSPPARWPTPLPRLRRPGARRGRPRSGAAGMGAGRLAGPLRDPVQLLRRLRPCAGERRLLLRPLRAAVRRSWRAWRGRRAWRACASACSSSSRWRWWAWASSSTPPATCSSTRRSSPPISSRTTSGSTRCSSTPTSTGASWPS